MKEGCEPDTGASRGYDVRPGPGPNRSPLSPSGPNYGRALLQLTGRAECFKLGLLDKDKQKPASASFSKYRLALIAANWIACNETMAWNLRDDDGGRDREFG